MIAFADSSAVVKRYADEAGAELVRSHDVLVVSALARVEVPAAFWGKVRTGELAVDDASVLHDAFTADWSHDATPYVPVAAELGVLVLAADVSRRHGLRAYDAVQLASALAVRSAGVELEAFLCFDERLAAAAAREGLSVQGSRQE